MFEKEEDAENAVKMFHLVVPKEFTEEDDLNYIRCTRQGVIPLTVMSKKVWDERKFEF